MSALIPSTTTASRGGAIWKTALAAALNNPQVIQSMGSVFGQWLKSGSSAAPPVIVQEIPKRSRRSGKRRSRRKGGSGSMGGSQGQMLTGRAKAAPLTLGCSTSQNTGATARNGKPQLCRMLGSFVKGIRVVDTEVTAISIVAQNASSTNGLYNMVLSGTSTGGINLGPGEIGPNRLIDIAQEYGWCACRRLRLRYVPTVGPSYSYAGILNANGLTRQTGLTAMTSSANGAITNFREVRALAQSMSYLSWERGLIDYQYNGEQVYSTINNSSNFSANELFQLELFGFGDANASTGSGTTLLGYLEADYVYDFYEQLPNVAQSVTLRQQLAEHEKKFKKVRFVDGHKIIEDSGLPPCSSIRELLAAAERLSHKTSGTASLSSGVPKDLSKNETDEKSGWSMLPLVRSVYPAAHSPAEVRR